MKNILIVLAAAVMLSSCSENTKKVVETQSYTYSAAELDLLARINHFRDSIGVGQVVILEHASFLCSEHNNYMIDNNVVNHDFFELRAESIISVYNSVHVGEILAYNYITNRSALTAWNNSPCHDTIVRSEFTRVGISIRENELHKKYYTVIFFD